MQSNEGSDFFAVFFYPYSFLYGIIREEDLAMKKLFKVCPSCGNKTISFEEGKKWTCAFCNFELYFNVATSASIILLVGNALVLVRRGKEPGKGLLSLPGGFVDPGESAENAAIRECIEETGITPCQIRYLCSFPNEYQHKNIVYQTCDLFFTANCAYDILTKLSPVDTEEVSAYELVEINSTQDIEKLPLAFSSAKEALLVWAAKRFK